MPLSQMFDKVFGMIKSNMYAIKLQEKVRELSVLDTTNRQIRVICLRGLLGGRSNGAPWSSGSGTVNKV